MSAHTQIQKKNLFLEIGKGSLRSLGIKIKSGQKEIFFFLPTSKINLHMSDIDRLQSIKTFLILGTNHVFFDGKKERKKRWKNEIKFGTETCVSFCAIIKKIVKAIASRSSLNYKELTYKTFNKSKQCLILFLTAEAVLVIAFTLPPPPPPPLQFRTKLF